MQLISTDHPLDLGDPALIIPYSKTPLLQIIHASGIRISHTVTCKAVSRIVIVLATTDDEFERNKSTVTGTENSTDVRYECGL